MASLQNRALDLAFEATPDFMGSSHEQVGLPVEGLPVEAACSSHLAINSIFGNLIDCFTDYDFYVFSISNISCQDVIAYNQRILIDIVHCRHKSSPSSA